MKTYTPTELSEILRLHQLYLVNNPAGVRANLRYADLTGADLRYADLRGANLRGADLRGANLSGANLPFAPAIKNIDKAILRAISSKGNKLEMTTWHTCETAHCRAGWAIVLAGDAGKVLEDQLGPGVAGALIYAASGSHPVPEFGTDNATALADLKKRAKK